MWFHEHYVGATDTERGRTLVTLRAIALRKFATAAQIARVSRAMAAAAAEMTDLCATPTDSGAPAVYVADGRLTVSIGVYLYEGVTTAEASGSWLPGWQVSTKVDQSVQTRALWRREGDVMEWHLLRNEATTACGLSADGWGNADEGAPRDVSCGRCRRSRLWRGWAGSD